MTVDPLPNTYRFGKVVGRVIRAVADTAEDADDKPQARPAIGEVFFEPTAVTESITTADYTAIVSRGTDKAILSSSGRILDAEGRQGVWLIVGTYKVTFSLKENVKVPPMTIVVTEAHTDGAPLDLATAVPYTPPVGVTVRTIQVPAGAEDGQTIVWSDSADGVVWATPSGGGGGGGAVDSVNGETGTVVLNAADVGAAPTSHVHPTSQVTGLDSALSGKAASSHTHAVSDVTGLQGALDGKQAAGSYAAANHNHDGTYQPAGSYAAASHTHPLADTTDSTANAGRLAMTNAERTKLGGVATGATANSTDAQLRDRTTHTGTIPYNGLNAGAAHIVSAGLASRPTAVTGVNFIAYGPTEPAWKLAGDIWIKTPA